MRVRMECAEDGTHYIVNGSKKWITNGVFADYFCTVSLPRSRLNPRPRPQSDDLPARFSRPDSPVSSLALAPPRTQGETHDASRPARPRWGGCGRLCAQARAAPVASACS